MIGTKTSAHDLSSVNGMASSGDGFDGIFDSTRRTSPSVTGLKTLSSFIADKSLASQKDDYQWMTAAPAAILSRIRLILPTKN